VLIGICFDNAELQTFLGVAAEKMGIDKFDARFYSFREQLYKQFLAVANLPKPHQSDDVVFINLKNGTFEISPAKQVLRSPQRKDFITYQLPFEYNPHAKAPLFESYLNRVLPDQELQMILAEYLGYVFIKSSTLKLEKTLLLYGTGSNGKYVFFEVVYALLGGEENVSSYSLQSLTNESGYHRAMLGNRLVNYASEINGKLETSIFKQLVSGEPVEARLPYGEPFMLTNYAKLIFNCNELPKEIEQTHAYFRRFLIIPFDVTIPKINKIKSYQKKLLKLNCQEFLTGRWKD
jgi:putative DNA primase/helicase